MGLLVDGQWRDEWYDTSRSGGAFERPASAFPPLDHRGWQLRVSRCQRALPPLSLARLPVVPPHAAVPPAEAPGKRDLGQLRRAADAGEWLDLRQARPADRRTPCL